MFLKAKAFKIFDFVKRSINNKNNARRGIGCKSKIYTRHQVLRYTKNCHHFPCNIVIDVAISHPSIHSVLCTALHVRASGFAHDTSALAHALRFTGGVTCTTYGGGQHRRLCEAIRDTFGEVHRCILVACMHAQILMIYYTKSKSTYEVEYKACKKYFACVTFGDTCREKGGMYLRPKLTVLDMRFTEGRARVTRTCIQK